MDSTSTLLDPAYELEASLAASDPALRRKRGVYFTPRQVASYLVRSVEKLLKRDFNLPPGLASDGVTIVDPACGSGVFLREVLEKCASSGGRPALVGFDVLSEACQAARDLIDNCNGKELARIVEINPLAAEEGEMAHLLRVERSLVGRRSLRNLVPPYSNRPLVVLGNPPWANFGRQNRSPWILDLLDDYKHGLNERKHNLGDDFIKFVRWGQFWIERAGSGVLAFVTSNTYLAGLTHRGMRRSLLSSFDDLYLYDLHGSSAKRDRAADGSPDENVFDVRSGTALCLLVKRLVEPDSSRSNGMNSVLLGRPRVHHAELRGARESKLQTLAETDVSTTRWTTLTPVSPMFFFVPGRGKALPEYQDSPRLDELFREYISGVQTKNDGLFTAFTREELAVRMQTHLAQGDVRFSDDCLQPYMTASFDVRWIYYEPRLLGRARWSVMQHMLRPNVGLVFMRQSTTPGEYDHFLAVRMLVSDRVFHSAHGAPFLAPLYLYGEAGRTPNLRSEAVERLAERWQLRFMPEGEGDLRSTFGPRDVLHYLYAVVHSGDYRRRYDAELRVDFPRLPLIGDQDRLRRLCELGRDLMKMHLSVAASGPLVESAPTSGPFMATIPADVRGFRLGGYDVVRRWIKQRKGKPPAAKDLLDYRNLIRVARETMRMRDEIDAYMLISKL